MFGFQGGETASTVTRKTGYRSEAQQRWRTLTSFDLSQIKNKGQLVSMLQVRYSLPHEQVKKDVEAWAEGKQF